MSIERLLATAPGRLPPGDAAYLVRLFGDYAAWVLHEEVLTKAEAVLGQPAAPGPMGALLARRTVATGLFVRDPRFPTLRETFLLPVQWSAHPPDHASRLERLEKMVAGMLVGSDWLTRRWEKRSLKLVPVGNIHSDARDLLFESDLFQWASAGGSLLLSAIQALYDLTDPLAGPPVLVSFCFDPQRGVQPVSHVTGKAALARSMGAGTIVVAESQSGEFRRCLQTAEPPVDVYPVPDGLRNLGQLLRQLSEVLLLPPADDADPGTLADYYLLLHRIDRERARVYYRDTLLPQIVARIRAIQEDGVRGLESRTLLTVLSKNPETTYLGIATFRPTSCYVIELAPDRELEQARAWLERELGQVVPETKLNWLQCSDLDEFLGESEKLRSTLRDKGVQDGALIVDLTPGPKPVSFGLLFQVVGENDYVCYLEHRWEDNLPRPFTERYRITRGQFGASSALQNPGAVRTR